MSRFPKKIRFLSERLVLLGGNQMATETQNCGLVYKIVKGDEVVSEAQKLAPVLADKPLINIK